jgi:hypothetical protein
VTRSRLPARFVLVASAVTFLVSACGNGFTAPAAVVNGTEITIERLKREVDTGLALSGTAPSQEARAEFTRQVLAFLIQVQVAADFARAEGIAVTPREVREEVDRLTTDFGGQAAFEEALRSRGVALEVLLETIRMNLLFEKVSAAVFEMGLAPPEEESEGPQGAINPIGVRLAGGSRDEQSAFTRWIQEQLQGGDIEVNPRFGRLDLSNGSIVRIDSTSDLA